MFQTSFGNRSRTLPKYVFQKYVDRFEKLHKDKM